ncbi:efflux RND transporter periplasmic adaptor subunit [Nitrospira sp. Kam-Ns4a]
MTRWSVSLLALLAACGPEEAPAPPAASAPTPAVVRAAVLEVRPVPVPIWVEVTGQVAAVTQATLASKVQGIIHEIRVREGSAVAKGDTLVVLDSRDLRANLARAEAELENARAHLQRMQHLFELEGVSRQELDNATRAFKVAEAGRATALAQLSYTVVKAPFDGVITEKKVEVGELASPGQPLLRMEDPTHLRLEATVAEGDLKAVARGDKVQVIVDALGAKVLAGTVAQILPTGDPNTHTFLVKVDLPPTPGLKTGMFGRLQLEKGVTESLVVPSKAAVERGQLTGVYVVGPDNVGRLRWVKIGRVLGQDVEVLSGLNVGERILADAAQGADGVRVEPVQQN